jgi:hypothetical protein
VKEKVLAILLSVAIFLSACSSAAATPTVDIDTINAQAVETVFAGMTQTVEAIPATATTTATPLPTLTAVRTPPALPAAFTTGLLDPLDVPQTYEADTCQYLRNKWDPNNAAPGTVVMTIMFHSITGDAKTDPNQVSLKEFRLLMKDLNELGFQAIDMQQMADFMYNNAKIPQRSVLLIVDDRHYRQYFDDFFHEYYQNWGWKVINAWISLDDSIGALALPENVALENEGWVDHQAHGFVHNIPMSDGSTDEYLEGELLGSKNVFEQYYSKSPIAIIWPGGGFGVRPAQFARQYGYKLGFTVNPRGPVMYNWVPQGAENDPRRPSYVPETWVGDPLMTLPRYWDTDARSYLDEVRVIGQDAATYAEQNKAVELEYYDIVCAPEYGAIPTVQ